MNEGLARKLWSLNADIAERCLVHPFVTGLADGSLDKEAFKRYVAQDAFFLRAFRKAFALAIARCDDTETAKIFHNLMGGVLKELNLHAAYSKEMGIEIDSVTPFPQCQAYTDFLQKTAWQDSVAEIVAAMAPCMVLYAWLGTRLQGTISPNTPYIKWIDTYASEDMQQLAKTMETLLDRMAQDTPEIRHAYRYAMKCEYDFFSAPLK